MLPGQEAKTSSADTRPSTQTTMLDERDRLRRRAGPATAQPGSDRQRAPRPAAAAGGALAELALDAVVAPRSGFDPGAPASLP